MKLSALSVITKSPDTAPNRSHLLIRLLFLLIILLIELIGVTYQFTAPIIEEDASVSEWLFANAREIWRIGVGFISIFFLSFLPDISRFKNIISNLKEKSTGYRWWPWLTGHFLALTMFIFITSLAFEKPIHPARLSAAWFAAWFALAIATYLLWLLSVAPSRFWLQLARSESKRLLMGFLLGALAGLLLLEGQVGLFVQEKLWTSLPMPTLWLVHKLLGWIYSDIIYQPDQFWNQPDHFWIGTSSFQVGINPDVS